MAAAAQQRPRPRLSSKAKEAAAAAMAASRRQEAKEHLKNAPSEILGSFLYLGDADNASREGQLRHFGIYHVLSITTDRDLGAHPGVSRLFLHLFDDENENIAATFDAACDFIEGARAAGGRVLVHCMAGRSRSATLVLVYLMRVRHMALFDAFIYAKKRRSFILPNVGFWQQMAAEELRLFGVASQTPSNYIALLQMRLEADQVTPSSLFRRFLTVFAVCSEEAAALEGQQAAKEWLEGWPSAKSVEEVLFCSVENLRTEARRAAVQLVAHLVAAGRVLPAEAHEAFARFCGADVEELRVDVPKIDDYLEEVRSEVKALGLLQVSATDSATAEEEAARDDLGR